MGFYIRKARTHGGAEETDTFKEFLQSKFACLQKHARQDKIHTIFSLDDEYECVRGRPLDFVEHDKIPSGCVIDESTELASFNTMKMKVPNIWCKALLFSWFSYNRSDGYDTISSLWKKTEHTRAFFIAINILRQFEISETDGVLYISKSNEPDSFYTMFPYADKFKVQVVDHKRHLFSLCKTRLNSFIYESIVDFLEDDELWEEVYKELVFLIPLCIYVYCPLVYLAEGHSAITKKANYGLIVRAFMFDCMTNLYVECDNVISNIWRIEHGKGDYYNLNTNEKGKEKYVDYMLGIDYEKTDNLPSKAYVLSEMDVYNTLADKYEHQVCFNIIKNFETHILQDIRKQQNIPIYQGKDDEKLGTIMSFINTNDIKDPLELYTTKDFGLFHKTLVEVFGDTFSFNIESILKKQIDLKHVFDMITHNVKIKRNQPPITSVGATLFFTNIDRPTSEDVVVLSLGSKLLDLFSGNSRVIFNASTITIGNNFEYSKETLNTTDLYDGVRSQQFIAKLEKIYDFISFLKVCRIYNTDYYNKILHTIHSMVVTVVNYPIYEKDIGESTIFTELSKKIKPQHGTVTSILEILKATTVILNISLFERSYGMTAMNWFYSYIEKLTISIEAEIDLNNFINDEKSLLDIVTSKEGSLL